MKVNRKRTFKKDTQMFITKLIAQINRKTAMNDPIMTVTMVEGVARLDAPFGSVPGVKQFPFLQH